MQFADPVDVLNELLAVETASELSRLRQSANFVSWAAAARIAWFDRLIRETEDHRSRLISEILRLGGSPAPVSLGIDTAGTHYLDFEYLLPRLTAEIRRLVDAYRRAQPLVAGDARVAALLAAIAERYEAALSELGSAAHAAAE